MRFRPCIDLHEGRVKQIIGSTLGENSQELRTNFVATQPPAYFASLYRRDCLPGGHVIMLGKGNETAAAEALAASPVSRLIAVIVPYGGLNKGNPCTVMPVARGVPGGEGAKPCTKSMSLAFAAGGTRPRNDGM